MKPKLLLKIAAIIMLLHAVGHTLAIITWQKPNGKIPYDLIQKMTDTHFSFQGNDATIANFFTGHGYAGAIFLLLIVSILWIVSGWNHKISTSILWPVAVSIILLSIDELIYFFPLAAVFSLSAAALVILSIVQLNRLDN